MPLALPILLAVFFALAVAQLFVLDLIRTRISKNHPEQFDVLAGQARAKRLSSMGSAVAKFAWRRGDKSLGDPALTRLTILCKRLYILMLPVFAGYAVAVFSKMH